MARHRDGIRDKAVETLDARAAFETSIANGARAVAAPHVLEEIVAGPSSQRPQPTAIPLTHSSNAAIPRSVSAWLHRLTDYRAHAAAGLSHIDHCGQCRLERNGEPGFVIFTDYTALQSKVMTDCSES
ncbi:MAG: hypothetical protein NVS2B17_08320 [Candidatus Velthaea sp.]